MDLEQHLLFMDVGAQVAFFLAGGQCALHGRVPCVDRTGQRVAHRAGAVVKLHRTADVDAPRVDLDRSALHPVGKHGPQPRQATRLAHRRVEHFLFKACVVLADHRNLQFLARAEVGEHAGLAHAGDLGQCANAQTFQADLGGQAQGRLDNGGLGLLTLVQRTPLAGGCPDGFGTQFGNRHGR